MKRTIFIITALILVAGLNPARSQAGSKATARGSKLISGAISFTSQGGDLYEGYNNERLNVVSVMPSLFYFVSPGLGIGADLAYDLRYRGSSSYTTLGVGPKIGYFGETGSNLIPFVAGGVGFLTTGSDLGDTNGYRIKFGGGVIIHKGRLGASFEVSYLLDSYSYEGSSESITGNTIIFGVGLVGFMFD